MTPVKCFRQNNVKGIFIVLICMFLCFILWRTTKEDNNWNALVLQVVDLGEKLACEAICRGDIEGLVTEDFNRLLRKRKRKALPESFYLDATKNCSAYIKNRGFLTKALSKDERDFPIAYSMVIHDQIEMFERLLRAVYTPQNVYCVHVDKKSPEHFIKAVMAVVSCFPNVFVASKLETIVNASWSRVQADLTCMQDLLHPAVQWRYLLNTCGADFPLKTNTEMVRILKLLNGKNSMVSETPPEHKKTHWEYHHNVSESEVVKTNIRKTPPPISTPMFSGNAYFVVSREFVEELFKNPEAKAFIEWEKDTFSPDEHLWATLQRMPGMPGSNPPNYEHDMTDMNTIAHLVKWCYLEGNVGKGAPNHPSDGVYKRSECVYEARDLSWILKQHHLLASKFDSEFDEVALTCLEQHLRIEMSIGQSNNFTETAKLKGN